MRSSTITYLEIFLKDRWFVVPDLKYTLLCRLGLLDASRLHLIS